MFKGTTPQHTFNVNIDTSLIKEIKITYTQNESEVLCKRTEDCTIEDGKIIARLTQEESFLFETGKFVFIQLRVLTLGGECLTSEILMTGVGKCLDSEVLV